MRRRISKNCRAESNKIFQIKALDIQLQRPMIIAEPITAHSYYGIVYHTNWRRICLNRKLLTAEGYQRLQDELNDLVA